MPIHHQWSSKVFKCLFCEMHNFNSQNSRNKHYGHSLVLCFVIQKKMFLLTLKSTHLCDCQCPSGCFKCQHFSRAALFCSNNKKKKHAGIAADQCRSPNVLQNKAGWCTWTGCLVPRVPGSVHFSVALIVATVRAGKQSC